jgi:two-component system response regulator MprA
VVVWTAEHCVARILIADDDAAIRALLVDLLRDEGHLVLVAGNGHEALLAAVATPPDLILIDLNMPVMTGVEAIRRIRAEPTLSAARVLALSSGALLRLVATDLADEVLAKPFELETLLAMINAQLAHSA